MFEEPNQDNVRIGYFLLTDDLKVLSISQKDEYGVWAQNDIIRVFCPYTSILYIKSNLYSKDNRYNNRFFGSFLE